MTPKVIHSYPLGDLRPHVIDDWPAKCWCRPEVLEEDGGMIVVHNSMDRREEYEDPVYGRKAS